MNYETQRFMMAAALGLLIILLSVVPANSQVHTAQSYKCMSIEELDLFEMTVDAERVVDWFDRRELIFPDGTVHEYQRVRVVSDKGVTFWWCHVGRKEGTDA